MLRSPAETTGTKQYGRVCVGSARPNGRSPQGRDGGGQRGRRQPAPSTATAQPRQGQEKGQGTQLLARVRGQHQGPGDLHPPVRHHDRRRSAPRAVPRDPLRPAVQQGLRGSAARREELRGAGRLVQRRAAQAPEDLRRTLRELGACRRSRRHLGHDHAAALGVPREAAEARPPGAWCAGLSDHRHLHRRRRDDRVAHLRDPGVRAHVR